MALDSQGYLWVATEGGLVRYDGSRFREFPLPTLSTPASTRLREIIPSLQGDLLVRDSGNRQFIIHDGRLSVMEAMGSDTDPHPFFAGGVPSADIYRWINDREGPLIGTPDWSMEKMDLLPLSQHEWLATNTNALLIFHDSTLVERVPRTEEWGLHFLLDGRVLCFYQENKVHELDPLTLATHHITMIGLEEVGAGAEPTFRFPWRTSDRSPCLLLGDKVYALRFSSRGDTLIASDQVLPLPAGCRITSLLKDEERGIMLVGTDTKGLFVYREQHMRTFRFNPDSAGVNNAFYAQVGLSDGVLLTSGNTGAPLLADSLGLRRAASPVPFMDTRNLMRDPQGRIWSSRLSEVQRFDPATGSLRVFDNNPLSKFQFHAFLAEGDSVWVATAGGLGYFKGDSLFMTTVRPPAKWGDPVALRRGPDGLLWVCSCDGVLRCNGRSGAAEPLAAMRNKCVRALQRDGERMYMGTYGEGAFVYQEGQVTRLPMDRQRHLSNVHAFMPDSAGSLWISTNQGLFRVREKEIDAFLQDSTTHVYYAYYGRSSGIANVEFNGGCDPPYVRPGCGFASFPTLEGLVWFKPESIPDAYPASPLVIDEVLVNNDPWNDLAHIVLGSGAQELTVRFSLSYWGDPLNAQIEYRLPGIQEYWYPIPTAQRELIFPRIPAGEHVLTIRKLGGTANDTHSSTELRFSVQQPFFRSTWFLLLCTALFILGYWLTLRVNQHRLRRKNALLARMVHARTTELERANERLTRSVETKERLMAIISHDIVAPLHFIARVAHRAQRSTDQDQREQLKDTLRDISLTSDKLYLNSRNLLSWIKHQGGHIELRPRHVAMNPFVDETLDLVRGFAASKKHRLANEVSLDDVLLTDRDVLGIILQNLIINAINHNERCDIRISGTQTGDAYLLVISDNGNGIPGRTQELISRLQLGDRPSLPERPSTPPSAGFGYVIITELIRLLRGELDVKSELGVGSRITIRLPLSQADQPGSTVQM